MHWTWKLVCVIGVGLIVGCTADSVKRGLYEGIKVQRDLQTTPQERIGTSDTPDYQSYERMRNERVGQ